MALEMNDIMTLKALGGNGHEMTPYEQFKVGHMQSKRASGVAIGALATGIGAAILAIGAGAWAGSRAQNAKEVAVAKNDGLRDLVASIATSLATERQERREGDINLTATINDTVSGSQQGSLTATQQAELNQAQQLMFGLQTGEYSRNPQRVALYRDATPCPCPAGGCNCMG